MLLPMGMSAVSVSARSGSSSSWLVAIAPADIFAKWFTVHVRSAPALGNKYGKRRSWKVVTVGIGTESGMKWMKGDMRKAAV